MHSTNLNTAQLRARMAEIGADQGLSIRTWARNGTEQPPRIVLCTTYRPEPALAVLRAARDGRLRTPIVALSANVMAHQVAEYRAAGMDAVVGKPFEAERLWATVAELTGGGAEAAEPRAAAG